VPRAQNPSLRWILPIETARAITRAHDSALAPAGLEATQFTVLAALADAETFTMTQLADRLLMDRTTLTRNVRPLVRDGYLRVHARGDQRRRFVELSGRGRRKLRAAFRSGARCSGKRSVRSRGRDSSNW